MAPITAPPLKILTDLGYEIWELETVEDIINALKTTINDLTRINENDGRIPILIEALVALRGKRKKESPSEGMKVTEKKTKINLSKFFTKEESNTKPKEESNTKPKAESTAKPTAKPKVNPIALLSPVQSDQEEDDNQSIFSTLLNGLKNIASLLKNIAALLGIQFIFKKVLAARKRRADALALKKKKEEELEGDKAGLGKKIKDTITKPVKDFWDTLLNFFKNIILGSALLGFYNWMKDPKNLETIKGIGEWFDKYGKAVLITLGALLALDIGLKAYRLVQAIRGIVRLLKFGNLFKRPWWKKPLNKTIEEVVTNKKIVKGAEEGIQKGVEKLNTAETARLLKEEQLLKTGRVLKNVVPDLASSKPTLVGRITAPLVNLADDVASQFDNFLVNITKNIKKTADPARVTEGLLNQGGEIGDKLAQEGAEAFVDVGKTVAQQEIDDLLVEGMTKTVAKSPSAAVSAIFDKGGTKVSSTGGMSGMDILKLVGDEKALKELLDNGTITKKVYDNLIKQGIENPVLGKALSDEVASKLINPDVLEPISKQAMKKLGPWGWFKRSLPIISTGLDAWSAIEELQKGNLQASLLFTGGAITSMVAPWWSFGLSMTGVAESIRADRAREADPNYEDPLGKYLKNIEFAPHMVTPQMMDFYSVNPASKKKNVNVVLAPTDTGDGSITSGSGATNSDVQTVASFDVNNPQVFEKQFEYDLIGAYSS